MSSLRSVAQCALFLAALSLGAAGCNDCGLQVATNSLPDAQVGLPYAMFLESSCGGDFWFVEGTGLPPGIGLRDDGLLSGTPALVGTFTFTVGVVDFGDEEQAFKGLALHVLP
jgi:hypothetical protein